MKSHGYSPDSGSVLRKADDKFMTFSLTPPRKSKILQKGSPKASLIGWVTCLLISIIWSWYLRIAKLKKVAAPATKTASLTASGTSSNEQLANELFSMVEFSKIMNFSYVWLGVSYFEYERKILWRNVFTVFFKSKFSKWKKARAIWFKTHLCSVWFSQLNFKLWLLWGAVNQKRYFW